MATPNSEFEGKTFVFQGVEGNPLNGTQIRVAVRRDGTLVDPVNDLTWDENRFKAEIAGGLLHEIHVEGLTKPERILAIRQLLTEAGTTDANSTEVAAIEGLFDRSPGLARPFLLKALEQKAKALNV